MKMNSLFQEKRGSILMLIVLFFILLGTLYFVFVRPQSEQLKSILQAKEMLQTDVNVLEKKIDNLSNEPNIDMKVLEEKMPLAPELDALLLSFQELEQVTGSRINEIDFAYDGELPEVELEEESESTEANDGESEEKKEERMIDINLDMEELGLVTAELTVLSPDYDHFLHFVKEVEKQERVTRVDQLEFTKPGERELNFTKDPDETVEYKVQVTTFYFKES